MNVWEFRRTIRSMRVGLMGYPCQRCPLGLAMQVKELGDVDYPTPGMAANELGLARGYACGVAAGWDGASPRESEFSVRDGYTEGYRYGRRLNAVRNRKWS